MTDDLQEGPIEKKETQKNVRDKAGNAMEENNKITDRFRYGRQERGPFAVNVRTIRDEDKSKPIKVIEIARKLANSNVRFDNIVESSKYIWRLTFNARETANACLSNLKLGKNGLEAFVPVHLRFKKRVIRDILVDVSLEEIQRCIQEENPNIIISDIHRLRRKNNKPMPDKPKWVDSPTICITFKSSVLPRHIRIWGVFLPVSDYITPIRICFNCGRYGHIKNKCENSEVCLSCSQKECPGHDQCQNAKRCVNCGGDHHTLDNKCPNRIAELEIKKMMARDNLSFSEAKKLVIISKKDDHIQPKRSLFNGNHEDFP